MIYQTKIGKIEIQEQNGKIIKVDFVRIGKMNKETPKTQETPLTKQTYKELVEYLEGKRKKFTVPIELKGTPFQIKVWNALQKIPYGQTRSYQDIAKEINNPKACRAVGMANHNNPIAIIVPCHRVIGKNNKMVGYAGGINIKETLLSIESNQKK